VSLLLTLIEQYGLWLVFANVLALQLGLPLPAYPTLIVVGAVAARGHFSMPQVVAVSVLACALADVSWYLAGARFGRRVLRLMCRLSLSPDSCVRQTEAIYERFGAPSLLVAKFIPGFAAVSTSMAGLMRTHWLSFIAFDTLGATLWSAVAVLLGYAFRDAVEDVINVFAQAGRWGFVALVGLLLLYLAVKAWQRHRLIRKLRMARIGVDELWRMLATPQPPLVIDVRSRSSQRHGRIPGALWVDHSAFEQSLLAHDLAERMAHEVIVYCACPNEASAAVVAGKLMRAGFARVRPLAGGIEAWLTKGYAVEGVETPAS
jgi:membrane protein DedA with SNARE-associated domain/rhodanese-related sulfurtransferase